MKNLLCFFLLVFPFLLSAQKGKEQTGTASYYAKKFEGKRTSSGEKFSNKKLTAAHKTFPYGTRLKVTTLSNNKSVIAVVNDRLQKKSTRCSDLSQKAAKELDFIRAGKTKVKIEIIKEE